MEGWGGGGVWMEEQRRRGWYGDEKAHCQILSLSPKEQRQAPQHLPEHWLWHLSMLLWLKHRPDDPVWTPIIWLAHLGACTEMKLSFVLWLFHCVSLCGERLMLFLFSLLFSTAPVVGLTDLKHWWSSGCSNRAQRYIFIMLQSAPKTLSLVFKPLDGKLQSKAGQSHRSLSF